jgi:hypothetical protein
MREGKPMEWLAPLVACATPECPHAAVCKVEGDWVCSNCAPKRTVFASGAGMPGPNGWDKYPKAQDAHDERMRAAGIKPTPLPWPLRLRRALSGSLDWGLRPNRDPSTVGVRWFWNPKSWGFGVEGGHWRRWGMSSSDGKYYFTTFKVRVPMWHIEVKLAERRPSWGERNS